MSYNYSALKAALISFVEDTSTDFSDAIDSSIIRLAEERVIRDLDLVIFDTVEYGSFTNGSPIVAKPAGCLATKSIIYTAADGKRHSLLNRDITYCLDYWPESGATSSIPKYYAEYSPTQWYIVGTPNAALSFIATIVKRPQSMSQSNPVTWLGTNVGDLLLYAALLVSEEFLKADERVAVWAQEYKDRLEQAKNELWAYRRAKFAPLVTAPAKVSEGE